MNDDENNKDELPRGWVLTRVCDLYDILAGGTPSTAVEEYWSGSIPWITSADIHGLKDIRPRRRITPDAVKGSATNLVPAGSIIVVTRVSLGKLALTQHPLCFSQDSQALIGNNGLILSDYALYYLSKAVEVFKYKNRGTTISGVTKKQLAELPFLLPPLPEQHRIVAKIEELFTRLEAGVEALKRTKALLKRYRQSVLKAAVEGRLTAEWREAHKDELEPASKLLERISQERRRRFVEKATDSVRAYVAARVSGAAVHNNPHEILQAFLTEMVVNDIDLSHANLLDRIAADFFELMAGVQDLSQQIRSYVLWLRHSLDALQAEGLKSDILISQWEAWQRYVEKEKNRKGPRREIVAIFGVGGGPMDAFSQWLTGESLRDHGAAHLRRTLIEEPADRNWKADEAKRKANQPDTSQLPGLPEGWEWIAYDEILDELRNGYFYGRPHAEPPGVPILRINAVRPLAVIWDDLRYVPIDDDEVSRYELRDGDLLFTRYNGSRDLVGVCGMVTNPKGFVIYPDKLIRARMYPGYISPGYVEVYFASQTARDIVEGKSKTTAGQHGISGGDLKSVAVALPPYEEQQRIVQEVDRRLSIADEVEATIDTNLKRAERLRQSILKQAFEGKLVPQDPNDEPASVLLERIREEKAKRERESKAETKSRRRGKGRKAEGDSAEPTLPMSVASV